MKGFRCLTVPVGCTKSALKIAIGRPDIPTHTVETDRFAGRTRKPAENKIHHAHRLCRGHGPQTPYPPHAGLSSCRSPASLIRTVNLFYRRGAENAEKRIWTVFSALSAFSAADVVNFQAESEARFCFFASFLSPLSPFSAISVISASLRWIRGYAEDAEAAEMITIECLIGTNPNRTILRQDHVATECPCCHPSSVLNSEGKCRIMCAGKRTVFLPRTFFYRIDNNLQPFHFSMFWHAYKITREFVCL